MSSLDAPTATTQIYRIYIKATSEAVWEAITTPEWSDRYGYGGRVEYDLRAGGAYRALSSEAMRAGGAPEVAVDGEVIDADPPRRLVQTWRMLMDEAMITEGFTRLTYELKEMPGGLTRLTVIHDLAGTPRLALLLSGGFEDDGAGGGWSFVLSSLKTLLETGSPMLHGVA